MWRLERRWKCGFPRGVSRPLERIWRPSAPVECASPHRRFVRGHLQPGQVGGCRHRGHARGIGPAHGVFQWRRIGRHVREHGGKLRRHWRGVHHPRRHVDGGGGHSWRTLRRGRDSGGRPHSRGGRLAHFRTRAEQPTGYGTAERTARHGSDLGFVPTRCAVSSAFDARPHSHSKRGRRLCHRGLGGIHQGDPLCRKYRPRI